MPGPRRPLTVVVELPGGQSRLRQMILHVASECARAKFFGAIKLNKIIWKADFDSFAMTGRPVTGREYRRQKFGPALREMRPVQTEMLRDGAIRIERRDFGDGFIEQRTVALEDANLKWFDDSDLAFVTKSIKHYWDMTGTETSDESHGIAWRTRSNGEVMPYESALLSDKSPGLAQMERLKKLVRDRMLTSE